MQRKSESDKMQAYRIKMMRERRVMQRKFESDEMKANHLKMRRDADKNWTSDIDSGILFGHSMLCCAKTYLGSHSNLLKERSADSRLSLLQAVVGSITRNFIPPVVQLMKKGTK